MAQVSVSVQIPLQVQLLQQRFLSTAQQLVEDVKVSLVRVLMHNPRLLQQVIQNVSAIRNALPSIKRFRDNLTILSHTITGAYQLKLMSIYFPKRDELLLRFVLALPKASKIGLVCSSLSLTDSTLSMWPEAAAMNCRTFFDASVFPEPDSPEHQRSFDKKSSKSRSVERLTRNQNALTAVLLEQQSEGVIRDREPVR